MHKTSAWPLSFIYIALVVFASLFPFSGWREQGIDPWVFLTARIPPPYWSGFDVTINVIGYAPLGFLLALALLRTGWRRSSVLLATLAGLLLSLLMEFLQIYLPRRVSSNLDWVLNIAGTLLGALCAALLERLGAIDRWSNFRDRWFAADARGALVLMALWPWALLFPVGLPFGLGQVLERLEPALQDLLSGTPFLQWLPVREKVLEPLSPGGEMFGVALGILLPCLLGYCVIRTWGRRALFALLVAVIGVSVTALSAALSWGPEHAWEWQSLSVRVGLLCAGVVAVVALVLPARVCGVLLFLALVVHIVLLNNAPTSAYFAQTLQAWEQGRFIRFYGLCQWLGWLWPYASLLYVMVRLSKPDAVPKIAP